MRPQMFPRGQFAAKLTRRGPLLRWNANPQTLRPETSGPCEANDKCSTADGHRNTKRGSCHTASNAHGCRLGEQPAAHAEGQPYSYVRVEPRVCGQAQAKSTVMQVSARGEMRAQPWRMDEHERQFSWRAGPPSRVDRSERQAPPANVRHRAAYRRFCALAAQNAATAFLAQLPACRRERCRAACRGVELDGIPTSRGCSHRIATQDGDRRGRRGVERSRARELRRVASAGCVDDPALELERALAGKVDGATGGPDRLRRPQPDPSALHTATRPETTGA